ncbi:MAG: F0F1 ATP synthase subunit B [bacterium]|nr:F0F1 ATP synthase subunit B [Candidatus Sumerlaeota bacterium]
MQETIAQVTTTLLAFIIFFVISKKLFWTGILRLIDERQAKVKADFGRIETLQKQADSLEQEYKSKLADIDAAARQKLQEEVAHGKLIADQIRDQAHKDATQELDKLKQKISIEMDKARAQLREEVVRMTIHASEHIMREHIDDAKNREMVSQFVEELGRK